MEPLLLFYHMSFALEAKVLWMHKRDKIFCNIFITCLLQEKQGYPESKRIVKYGVSLVYGKSWGWPSIKMQYHDHQFESILSIPSCSTLRSSIKMQRNDHQS
jgi:hypothetical protein